MALFIWNERGQVEQDIGVRSKGDREKGEANFRQNDGGNKILSAHDQNMQEGDGSVWEMSELIHMVRHIIN